MGTATAVLAALLQVAAASHAYTLDAKVVSVTDGDTFIALDSNKLQHKIRIQGIDAPESGQPFGQKSKQSLSRAVMGKEVRLEWRTEDSHGRPVAKVWVAPPESVCRAKACPKTIDVGLAQITVGLAWHFKRFEKEQSSEDRRRYAAEEKEARARKAGLWSQPDPVPPWDWRQGLAGGPIKKSQTGICHAPDSPSYKSVKKFTAYPTVQDCLESGGRLPKQSGK